MRPRVRAQVRGALADDHPELFAQELHEGRIRERGGEHIHVEHDALFAEVIAQSAPVGATDIFLDID